MCHKKKGGDSDIYLLDRQKLLFFVIKLIFNFIIIFCGFFYPLPLSETDNTMSQYTKFQYTMHEIVTSLISNRTKYRSIGLKLKPTIPTPKHKRIFFTHLE